MQWWLPWNLKGAACHRVWKHLQTLCQKIRRLRRSSWFMCADRVTNTHRVIHHEIRTNDQTTRRNNARETGEWSPHTLERYHGRMRHKCALICDVALVYGGLNRHLFLIFPNPITGLVRKLMVLKIRTAWTSNPWSALCRSIKPIYQLKPYWPLLPKSHAQKLAAA